MEEDRSALFKQLQGFSQRKLKKVETKVVTGLGEQLVEKRGAKGLQVLSGGSGNKQGDASADQEPARKLDLQVGFILPGLLIGSQDVAQDKSSLDSYGIEYILNLDSEVENKYEDDFNYKNVPIKDKPDFDLDAILDDCFDFIDEGRHRGNVLVHCSGTTGLSRSTSICIAYLMKEEKQSFADAFNNVKEARSFVKPNDGFIKQLKDYEVKLRGAQKIKESGIDDPFALRKKQEIEQEKAMVAGAASVKNRMKMFGATLDTGGSTSPRSKSVSPMPVKQDPSSPATTSSSMTRPQPSASKWATTNNDRSQQSKSMTPEPRKSDWQSSRDRNMPPPPPPPMPTSSLHANDKSVTPMNSNASSNSTSSKSFTSAPPPPPPQPPAGHLLRDSSDKTSPTSSKPSTTTTTHVKSRKPSVSESSDDNSSKSKQVFGRKPPPPMKIRGGLSIERNDQSSTSDKQTSSTRTQPSFNRELMSNFSEYDSSDRTGRATGGQVNSRCPSPLVLTNNVTPSPPVMQSSNPMRLSSRPASPHVLEEGTGGEPSVNPFEYWQKTLKDKAAEPASCGVAYGSAPKRTVSLGPRRPKQVSATLQRSPFLREPREQSGSPSAADRPKVSLGVNTANLADRFDKAARELQSSLTELNVLIDSPEIGSSSTLGRRVARSRPPITGGVSTQDLRSSSSAAAAAATPTRSLNTGLTVRIDQDQDQDQDQDDSGQAVPRWQWQDDLANWKMSSSVNDLKSMFQQPSTARLSSATPSLQSSTRPPLSSAVIGSSLKDNPWLSRANKDPSASNSDYTIRRTTSISTTLTTNLRPPAAAAANSRNARRSDY